MIVNQGQSAAAGGFDYAGMAAGLQLGSAIGGYLTQKKQAEQLKDYYAAIQKQNNELARRSAVANYEQILTRRGQERARSVQSMLQISSQSARAAGSAQAIAAETGGGVGQSFSQLLQDFENQESRAIAGEMRNQQWVDQQTNASLQDVRRQYEQALINNIPPPVMEPNFGNAVISGIANAGTAYYYAQS